MGGKASPQFGTIGEGYNVARSLGLTVTKTFPGLTWIEVPKGQNDIQGVRAKGKAKLYRKGQLIAEEEGEIQFTKVGLSGICIFNLSSQVVLSEEVSFNDYKISLDLMTAYSIKDIQRILEERSYITGITIGNILRSIIPSPLEKEVLDRLGISLEDIKKPATSLSEPVRKLMAHELKDLSYPIKGIGGWKDAQITIGGVSLSEVNPNTWESNKVPGLYIVGELLDKQGPCGGYNLHNAWKTGMAAGKALGK
jgi:predicted Rossmann fold flavoprotein